MMQEVHKNYLHSVAACT